MKRFRATSLVLALLCIMYFITYLDRVNVSTAAIGFGKEFHLLHVQVGLVFSGFAYPYLVFQIIGGWVSDRFGAKRTLIFCGLLWTMATVLTGFAGGLVSLLVARVLLGLGEGATLPAATAAMSRWVAKEKYGFAQGITHAAARVGNAAAPLFIVLIMVAYGWREVFHICGAISLAWVVAWWLIFTESAQDHPRITREELDWLPQAKPKVNAIPWRALFKRMAPVTVVYFCYGWTLWLLLSWIPQYFLHSHHLNLAKSALFSSIVFLAGVLGDTMGGFVTDKICKLTGSLKWARSWMVSICMLCTLVVFLPLMLTHSLYLSMACLTVGFFFLEMTIGPMWAIPMDIAPEYSGTASGMMNTGSALAAIISPVLSGFLIDCFGNWELPFAGSVILLAIGGVLAFRMEPESAFELTTTVNSHAMSHLGA